MAARTAEQAHARAPWVWAGAMLLLGTLTAGLVGAAVALWQYIDIEALMRPGYAAEPVVVTAPVAEVPLAELTATRGWTAYRYESERSAGFFPERGYYDELTERWDALLAGVGADVRRISGAQAIDSLDGDALLVMPVTVCLGDDERDAVLDYIDRGGNLLATWAIGARDESCEWLGYGFLRDIARVSTAGTLDGGPPTSITVPSGGVLSAGLPPGLKIELRTEEWIVVRANGHSVFWSDWALNPLPAPYGGAAAAAITRTTESGGRIAWFGYRLDVAATDRDQRLLRRLAETAALWAGGHVVAEVSPWPDGYRAAMAITQDVEHSFKNSRRLARRFRDLGVPVTFFAVSQLALEHPDLAGLLSSAGELGSHSADHRSSAGRPLSAQLAAARRARAEIESWSGTAPRGFRPPREFYDSLTLEAWGRSGGLYVAAYGERSAAPELHRTGSGPVVVLPRVVDDDYALMVERGQMSADSLRASLSSALEKMRSLGGLHLVTLHTQLINSDRRLGAVEDAVRTAQDAGDVWIAGGSEIAQWWLERSTLDLQLREVADGSVVLSVRNDGWGPVSSAWLKVYLPEDRDVYAAPELGQTIVESEYVSGGLRFRLPTVEPGRSVDILLPRRSI